LIIVKIQNPFRFAEGGLKMIHVAIVQMCASGPKEENLATIRQMVKKAVDGIKTLDLICFPEYCYAVPTAGSSLKLAEGIPGTYTEAIAKLSKEYRVNISAGSFVEKAEGKKVHNTSLFFNREGKIIGEYRKMHLMDAMSYKESDSVSPGNSVTVFDTDFARVGVMVCYDLRFPELTRTMVLKGAEIILVPSAFPSGQPLPPRTDHWDVLVRSTALLNLVYVVATNQFGPDQGQNYFGRSSIIDPWGTRIVQASGRQGIVYGVIDLEYQKSIRASLPTWKHRRTELYSL
jgi:predicted amidohydrolase